MIVKHFNQAQLIINQKARLAFITTSRLGEPLKRRCGRQYSNAYANDRPFFTPEHFSGDMSKGADITSLFVRRSVFLAFWGKYDGQSSDSNIEDADHQDQQMADELDVLDRDTIDTSDGDQDMAVPSSSGEDPNQDSDMTDGLPRARIESAQGGEMRNSLPAARPGPVRNSGLVRKRHPRGIVEQWKRREKNKKEQRGPSGANRSSALTTFVPDRESVDPDDTARMPLEYAAKMTILLRQDGEWKEVKECRRSDIVESIDEVRRDFLDQHWFLYDKDGRGIDLKDCLTHENDFVCLNTDSSGFPAELILQTIIFKINDIDVSRHSIWQMGF